MSGVEPLGAVRIANGDVYYAQGMKAGGWVFLTGHEAVDFDAGLAPEVAGKSGFPLHGTPKHRREGDFILRRFERLLAQAGTDLAHAVRLDQYYPTWKAVDPYHHARRAIFGDYIPPSTSVLMSELLHAGADIDASLLAVLPGGGRDPQRVQQTGLAAPRWSGFAPVVTSGDFVFLAGHMAHYGGKTGVDPSAHVPDDNLWGGTEIILQTEFILRELIAPGLKAAGSSVANVLKAQAYLSSVEDFPLFMQVWNAWFGDHPCALSVIPTAGFASVGGIVEINFLAVKDGGAVEKEIVAAGDIPSTMAYGPAAVRAGDLLLLSGLMATDEAGAIPAVRTGAALPYHAVGPRAQMRCILESARRICDVAGTSLDNVVRAHHFHTDLAEFYPMHKTWQEFLPGRPIPYGAVRVPAPMPAPGCTVIADLWVYAP